MNNFLHSLPWTLALAMAQAGEGIPRRLPDSGDALLAAESGTFEADGASPAALLRLSDFDEGASESASEPVAEPVE